MMFWRRQSKLRFKLVQRRETSLAWKKNYWTLVQYRREVRHRAFNPVTLFI